MQSLMKNHNKKSYPKCCPQEIENQSQKLTWWAKLLLPFIGLFSLIWFLIRVIPKPTRATYPCMKVAAPIASTFIVYILGFLTSIFGFKKAKKYFNQSRFLIALCFIVLGISAGIVTFLQINPNSYADNTIAAVDDPFGPNNPIGEAKGIIPGRVVWIHDPAATSENCKPDVWGDGYFLVKNCDQSVVDDMFSKGLRKLTECNTDEEAWDAVFRYYNQNHDKGDVGYDSSETIFIKVNAVHAWTTNSDLSIKNDADYGNVDTSPQAILAMLKQLVQKAGVPQENIFVGDPFTEVFKHCYEIFSAEFPNIHYISQYSKPGRTKLVRSDKIGIRYSDKGSILDETHDYFYKCHENSDYLINIPAMKGHRLGGITLFAKNFFGISARDYAWHLHPGLNKPEDHLPMRGEYGMYRVLADIMFHKNLGGKSLIYFMDALWACSFEHEPPVKFQIQPFNNDWFSSLFFSLDPVAIESVCLDFLQAEFPETIDEDKEGYHWYSHYPAVDDYIHQCADSANWPEGFVYDPENDGILIPSLGVHEHWNNGTDRQYTRNLKTGDGIELISILQNSASAKKIESKNPDDFILHHNYPNPFNPSTTIEYSLPTSAAIRLNIFNVRGEKVRTLLDTQQPAGVFQVQWDGRSNDGSRAGSGIYFCRLDAQTEKAHFNQTKRMVLMK